ncbi:MAG: polysaccharide deacetylase family protein [Bdellovibrionales bacterium]|nr:polysaccharide deacetylase family protein [Bdellovibrionales bacterium]
MRKNLLSYLSLSFVVACASSGPQNSSKPVAQSASAWGWGRRPASAVSALPADTTALLRNAQMDAELSSLMNQLERVFYASQSNLQAFDARLDRIANGAESGEILNDNSYSQLMAGRQLGEMLRERIADHYRQLLTISADRTLSAADGVRKAAIDSLVNFHRQLSQAAGADVLALMSLAGDLQQAQLQLADAFAQLTQFLTVNRDQAELQNILPRSQRLFQDMVAKGADDLQRRAKEAEAIRDDLMDQLVSWTQAIQMLPSSLSTGREPQALKIFPSTSASGNMFGDAFPTNTWALTYDDGPSGVYTPSVLANLQKHGVKATFFWLAGNVASNPAIVAKVKAAGMPLENHSWSHANLAQLGEASLNKEINQAQIKETAIYGVAPKFFRCPYGSGYTKAAIRSRLVALKMVHVYWNVDSLDWQDKNPATVLARVQKQMKVLKRGIILFHDIHPQSVAASNSLMDAVLAANKTLPAAQQTRFVTIPDIVGQLNGIAPGQGIGF